jgi:tellurite resistance protein
MRTYTRNSSEAAARIVALVLISDGHVCRSELEALNQLDGARELGLDMPGIVQTLCEDLLMEGFSGRPVLSHIDDRALATMMAEVDEPRLQAEVLRIATSVAHADRHLSEGETAMLETLNRAWRTRPVTAFGQADTAMAQPS